LISTSRNAAARWNSALFLLPEGYRDGAKVDPEKMFVATIASALSWLHDQSS